jgi:autotransporter-associated beta strand protein
LVKPNAGSLQLMGNNTYTGGSSIGAGNVGLFHNNALARAVSRLQMQPR